MAPMEDLSSADQTGVLLLKTRRKRMARPLRAWQA
jgi:hypothetical protein